MAESEELVEVTVREFDASSPVTVGFAHFRHSACRAPRGPLTRAASAGRGTAAGMSTRALNSHAGVWMENLPVHIGEAFMRILACGGKKRPLIK